MNIKSAETMSLHFLLFDFFAVCYSVITVSERRTVFDISVFVVFCFFGHAAKIIPLEFIRPGYVSVLIVNCTLQWTHPAVTFGFAICINGAGLA